MAIFKCKMCGGTIEFEQGATVGVCDSCGTKQTLPRLDDDRKANLYDRANHFRRNNEFDKAMGIYEQILNEDSTDAEAYWSLVLCKYGIEYVEDPATHKRVPTVNRAQYTSIFADEDYKSAIEHADGYQKDIYESEATVIDEIQKGILDISSKEEPFDVFICYKETDANGRRTPDSVLATELYHELTRDGFKVFFSRITLEDKLGQEYEPYIFAALNSAKVMVVLGTKAEHFNAVWVKNEWSRYLSLIKNGARKILIPAYKDMDPYDLPEEFSHLQAQDMSKLGFMQDLVRGIKKMVSADEQKPVVKETVINTGVANVAPLLKRAFMFLEDGDWQSADEYCEKVLDQDPENGEAYFIKLLVDLKLKQAEQLASYSAGFTNNPNYKKARRFGNEKMKEKLDEYEKRVEELNKEKKYQFAIKKIESFDSERALIALSKEFEGYGDYKEAPEYVGKCLEKAEECRKESIYVMAGEKADELDYYGAIETYKQISGWRDVDEKIAECEKLIEKREQMAEERRRLALEFDRRMAKRKKIILISTIITVTVLLSIIIVYSTIIVPKQKYNNAISLLDSGKYEDAYLLLEEIENNDAIASSKYDRAVALIDSGNYEAAYMLLNGLNYKDSAEKADECLFLKQKAGLTNVKAGSTIKFGFYEQDNNTSNGKEEIEWKVLAVEGNKALVISKYALDCQQYNTEYTDVTWETCSLRKWLNGTFINNAFSSDEQNMIQSTTVTADKNPTYSTSPGNNTTDKVFLLSITEVNKYFSSDEARKCAPTDYAIARGAFTSGTYITGGRATCWWWLRSPGNDFCNAASAGTASSVSYFGDGVDSSDGAVRPALWIDIGD